MKLATSLAKASPPQTNGKAGRPSGSRPEASIRVVVREVPPAEDTPASATILARLALEAGAAPLKCPSTHRLA